MALFKLPLIWGWFDIAILQYFFLTPYSNETVSVSDFRLIKCNLP